MGYVHENHELIAADPGKSVCLANPASHPFGDLLEQTVPRLVAQRVVDRLEAVDVEQEQRDLAPAPCRSSDHLRQDRKSTRLNSSHLVISYAVFCLKKKKKEENNTRYNL